MKKPRKYPRIKLSNGTYLSQGASDYVRKLAKENGLSVAKYIEKKGGQKKFIDFINKKNDRNEEFPFHIKAQMQTWEDTGFTFFYEGEKIDWIEANFLMSAYYYDFDNKGKLLMVFNFNIKPLDKEVYLKTIETVEDSSLNGRKQVYPVLKRKKKK